jgi:hypothetical protein
MQADYKNQVEPLRYVGILILAIFCTILSANYTFIVFESFFKLLAVEENGE